MNKTDNSKRIFPIKNEAACVYKWSWNTLRLYNGTTSSCHRNKPVLVDIDDFENFHNTTQVVNDRVLMNSGQWPAGVGCEYCKNIESNGGISDRLYHNNIPGLTPVDFSEDASKPLTPRILEIYFHNTCDLACMYCLPVFSSRINEEIKKFVTYPAGIPYANIIDNREEYYQKFLTWFDEHRHDLSRLSVLGGEPLLQKEIWNLLDRLKEQNNPDLELAINTNLNCDIAMLEKFVDTAYDLLANKKLKRVDISCSLDCWGPQAEFVRYGLKLDNWQRNFEYLIQNKWLYINVHHVLTSLTISTAIDLQRKIAEYKKINKRIVQSYNIVDGSNEEIYHPGIFDYSFFDQELTQLVNEYPITDLWDIKAKERLVGHVKFLKSSTININRLKKLKDTLDMTDARRSTDWKLLFPKINQYFIENNI